MPFLSGQPYDNPRPIADRRTVKRQGQNQVGKRSLLEKSDGVGLLWRPLDDQ